jgi:putative hemolysin
LPRCVLFSPRAVECGRACIALDHRSPATVLLLWAGIGAFMKIYEQRYLFGCCSLTSQDPDEGWRALRTLRAKGYVHPELWLRAMPEYTCGPAERESDPALKGELEKIPKLFNAYMRLGSKVISEPAIDREFGTVDFLVLLDGEKDVNYSSLNVLV